MGVYAVLHPPLDVPDVRDEKEGLVSEQDKWDRLTKKQAVAEYGASLARAGNALQKLAEACKAIALAAPGVWNEAFRNVRLNQQGKRKQGLRNPYSKKWRER